MLVRARCWCSCPASERAHEDGRARPRGCRRPPATPPRPPSRRPRPRRPRPRRRRRCGTDHSACRRSHRRRVVRCRTRPRLRLAQHRRHRRHGHARASHPTGAGDVAFTGGGAVSTTTSAAAGGLEAAAVGEAIPITGPDRVTVGVASEFSVAGEITDPTWAVVGLAAYSRAIKEQRTFVLTAAEVGSDVKVTVTSGSRRGEKPVVVAEPVRGAVHRPVRDPQLGPGRGRRRHRVRCGRTRADRPSRRRQLRRPRGTARRVLGVSAVAGQQMTSSQSGQDQPPSAGRHVVTIVDIHCHTFNADDLPVRGFRARTSSSTTSPSAPSWRRCLDVLVQRAATDQRLDLARGAMRSSGRRPNSKRRRFPCPPQSPAEFEREVDEAMLTGCRASQSGRRPADRARRQPVRRGHGRRGCRSGGHRRHRRRRPPRAMGQDVRPLPAGSDRRPGAHVRRRGGPVHAVAGGPRQRTRRRRQDRRTANRSCSTRRSAGCRCSGQLPGAAEGASTSSGSTPCASSAPVRWTTSRSRSTWSRSPS